MNLRRFLIGLTVVPLLALFTACPNPLQKNTTTGSLIVRINGAPPKAAGALGVRTITGVSSVQVKLSNDKYPSLYASSAYSDAGTTVQLSNIKAGSWSIQVYLNDGSENTLYYGEGSVEIKPGLSSDASVDVFATGGATVTVEEGIPPPFIEEQSIDSTTNQVTLLVGLPYSIFGATFRYRTDGNDPAVGDTSYEFSETVTISFSDVLKAMTVLSDGTTSKVVTYSYATGRPEICVKLSGVEIPSGSGLTDLGPVMMNNVILREFVIENQGERPLHLTGTAGYVSIEELAPTGGDTSSMMLVAYQPASSVVAPGSSESFDLECVFMGETSPGASAYAINMIRVNIDSDDGDEAIYSFLVEAHAVQPLLALARTGESTSYADRDDGYLEQGVEWPSPRFTDNSDGTITDNLTGLMWEKTPGAGSDGTGTPATCMWTDAKTSYCDPLTLAGHTDWRMPNINELRSLVNYGQYPQSSWLADQGFTLALGEEIWSSTSVASDSTKAWTMLSGGSALSEKEPKASSLLGVWAVRTAGNGTVRLATTGDPLDTSGVALPNPRFVDNGMSGMTDLLTGLTWEKRPGGGSDGTGSAHGVWSDALSYAATLTSPYGTRWHLPNINERASLIDYGESSQVTWLASQGFSAVPNATHTSTTLGGDGSSAWYVGSDGWIDSHSKSSDAGFWVVW